MKMIKSHKRISRRNKVKKKKKNNGNLNVATSIFLVLSVYRQEPAVYVELNELKTISWYVKLYTI